MANVNIQIAYKNSAWFAANPTLVLLVGQLVYLEQTGTYKIGDGVTALSALSFLGAASSVTKTSDLINDGDDGVSHFITLNDLPSNLTLYATNAASDISGYFKLVSSITDPSYNTVAVDIPTGTITTTNQFIASLATSTNIIVGNPGVFNITTIGQIQKLTGTGNAEFYFEVWKRVAAGTETLITTSALTLPVLNSGYAEFSASALWNDGVFISTDRIVLKFYGSRVAGGSNPTYQFQFGGLTPVRSLVPIPLNVTTSISQTITNGVTDKTPSEDAVYDALNNKANKANGLVSGGAITVGTFGANNVRVASAIWFITPNSYTTVGNTDFLVALSAAGLQRFVGFYGNITNTITKVEGVESEVLSYPDTPVGTALIGYLLVTDSAASSTPDLSGYLLASTAATTYATIANLALKTTPFTHAHSTGINVADNTNYIFGFNNFINSTGVVGSSSVRQTGCPATGTIKAAIINIYVSNASSTSTELATVYLSSFTGPLIYEITPSLSHYGISTNQTMLVTGLNIPVTLGQKFASNVSVPLMVTNPTGVLYSITYLIS